MNPESKPPATGADGRADFLAGVRILELGDGVAGASTTSVLWSLGAEVTTLVDPASPHRRGRPSVEHRGGTMSLLALALDRGKQVLDGATPDDLEQVIGDASDGFDLVVVDRVHGGSEALAHLRDVTAYLAFVDARNAAGWVTISAFGLSGDRAGDFATELTVAAASGMLATVRDPSTGQPLKLAGQQSLLNTGQAGALAACHALDLTADGDTVHLDLAATEATLAMGPVLEVGGLLLNTVSAGGARRYGAPASFYDCRDGLVRISAMEDHQWNGVVAAMGSPDWAEQFASVDARIEGADEVDDRVAAWAETMTKQEAETVLQANGVPATAVYAPVELLDSPQLAHRGAFAPLVLDDGREATVVGSSIRIVDGGNERGSRRTRRTLRDLRMLEASRVLAVPLAGSILGALGAEVTKLEDLQRLDMYRRRGPYIDGRSDPDSSAYFSLMNHSKVSVAFDVDADPDRLAALVNDADVVIENLGPKRAGALGLGAATALECHPDLLALSSTGFGQDGPYARYRAYAYNLQASGALGFLTRNEAGQSAEIDIAWADLISAYALATIVAAWAVGPEGNAGVGVDFAMADLVISHFNEVLAAASLDPGSDATIDRANDLAPFAPHGVYPTATGWIAVAVEDDDQYARLATVVGDDGLSGPRFASSADRFERRRELDAALGAATRRFDAADLAESLRASGIAAEAVLSAADLLEDGQLTVREFFTPVEHPVWGTRRLVGLPWRIAGQSAIGLRPPPSLGPVDAPSQGGR